MEADAAAEGALARAAVEEPLPVYSPPSNLLSFAVDGAPQGTYYIPNFIEAGTEEMLLQVRIKSESLTSRTPPYSSILLHSLQTDDFLYL